jgi:hypothetical protein
MIGIVIVGGSGGISFTFTVASPNLSESAVDVAFTVSVAAVSFILIVNSPSDVIAVSGTPPNTSHITDWSGLFSPCTSALNIRLSPF